MLKKDPFSGYKRRGFGVEFEGTHTAKGQKTPRPRSFHWKKCRLPNYVDDTGFLSKRNWKRNGYLNLNSKNAEKNTRVIRNK